MGKIYHLIFSTIPRAVNRSNMNTSVISMDHIWGISTLYIIKSFVGVLKLLL
jgi:hypothetical protein